MHLKIVDGVGKDARKRLAITFIGKVCHSPAYDVALGINTNLSTVIKLAGLTGFGGNACIVIGRTVMGMVA